MRCNNVVSLDSMQPTMNLNLTTQRCVEHCKTTFSGVLFQHFQAFLSRIDDTLFALADKADDDTQAVYFNAMRAVRKHRKLMATRFQAQWLLSFADFWRTGRMVPPAGPDGAPVNWTDEGMAAKAVHRYQASLAHLNQAFTTLSGELIEDNNNPFSPHLICDVYAYATQDIQIENKVRLILGKLFERYVMAELEPAYQQLLARLNQFLHPQVSAPEADLSSPSVVSRTVFAAKKQASDPSYLDVVQHGGAKTYEVNDELKADLSALLAYQGDTPKKQDKSQSPSSDNNTHMVNMMFEFMLDDRNLPKPIKTLIARLQTPMVKVGLLDKQFLQKKAHPARRLLSELVQAGVKWNPQEGQGGDTLFGKMSHVVKRVLVEFEDDMTLFEDLLNDFSAFLEQEGRYAQAAERRTTQIKQGKEHLDIAKLKANSEVDQRLRAFYVPSAVRELIEQGWANVLLLVYLRKGFESEAWHNAIQVLDEVVWTCQPKNDPSERQKMLRMIPKLLKRLRTGLNGISYDEQKTLKLLKDLQAYHVRVLRGELDISVLHRTPVVQPEVKPDSDATPTPQVDDAHLQQAKTLDVGIWIEYLDENHDSVRSKLSWKSDMTGTYVFVNRRGVKVMELSLNGLASLLRRETTSLLEDVSVIDRAMSSMLNALKR